MTSDFDSRLATAAARRADARRTAHSSPPREVPILERLGRMAISAHRVADERSVCGEILMDVDREIWRPARAPGYLDLLIADHGHEGTIAVVLTRFVVDGGADVAGLLDHACVEARDLPEWDEQEVTRAAADFRTEGASLQTGTYVGDGETWFCAIRYAAYRRGNVGYLLHVTGTAPAREGAEFRRAIAATIGSARLDD
ncbi:LpqN/LpqT family lipoprotein [Gordonia soli]|nr:LpqN/LpqT family lipoprotein [Gordonia soli]